MMWPLSLLQWVGHFLQILLEAHGLVVLGLDFGWEKALDPKNLPLLQRKGHSLERRQENKRMTNRQRDNLMSAVLFMRQLQKQTGVGSLC